MNTIRAVILQPDRLTPYLPLVFAALVGLAAAMQSTVRPMRLEIPSGVTIGVAPQESVPPATPPAAVIVTPLTPVLPQESVPGEAAEPSASVAIAPPSVEAPAAGAAAVAPLLGLPGSGNLKQHGSDHGRAVSALVANLMQTIQHLRARAAARPVRHPLALTRPHSSKAPQLARESIGPIGLGGATPRRGDLGGISPLAQRLAPAIDGVSFKRKY
jgi:hypothetical protein